MWGHVIALLLSLVLAAQGIPVQPQQGGKVTGVLKDSDGKPIAGIRMAAIARPDSLEEAVTSAAMSSLSETDADGRYTLENIPPGKYYIAAGRLDLQTYYPGTPDMAAAREVAITPGASLSGIDFTMGNSSFGRATTSGSFGLASPAVAIPLRVTVEGGGKMPLSGAGKITSVKLDMAGSVITTPLAGTVVNVPGPQTTAYRVTVENLPETYAVKSIMYGTTDLLTSTLRLTPANFPSFTSTTFVNGTLQALLTPTQGARPGPAQPNASPPLQIPQNEIDALNYLASLAAARGVTAPAQGPTPAPIYQFGVLPQDPAGLQAYLAGIAAAGQAPAGLGQVVIQTRSATGTPGFAITMGTMSTPQSSVTPPSLLSITLAPAPPKPTSGVRVSGRANFSGARTIYLSGIPGTVYSDGTFEVYGVPPGRHVIVTRFNPTGLQPLAASLVVEDRDLGGIVLTETAMLPLNSWEPAPPRPAGGQAAGNVPLARLTGTLVEELSRQPIPEGTVILKANGYYSVSFPVDTDGHFELPPLLPGNYDFEIQIFGHSNVKQSIEIDDKDIKLEITSRRLY